MPHPADDNDHSLPQEPSTAPVLQPLGTRDKRRERGAFFTPAVIADYLARWAVQDNPNATVLDPTCGGGIFLQAAGRRLLTIGANPATLSDQLFGIDIHADTIRATSQALSSEGLAATIVKRDFFQTPVPGSDGSPFPQVDAVLGNPPFVRFHQHAGENRRRSVEAAFKQGVQLPGTASSWAASLVHASAFVKPEGTVALVLPAELLTVSYAEPVRRWLQQRFASVRLVFFDRLQFPDAQENVVLLIASGSGGCDSFTLVYAEDGATLDAVHALSVGSGVPSPEGKWTSLLLTMHERGLVNRIVNEHCVPLSDYGRVVLGTVTGANNYFCIDEGTRRAKGLVANKDVIRTVPPGTKGLTTLLNLNTPAWERMRDRGERVWMLNPETDRGRQAVDAYLNAGEADDIPLGYKCSRRTPWWKIPVVEPPDLFFTYMSHLKPRLVTNSAGITFLNSLHGVRLHESAPRYQAAKLALCSLNSLTLLCAEMMGRSYGGGVLKLEPTEASALPMLSPGNLDLAWDALKEARGRIERRLSTGRADDARALVDELLLEPVLGLSSADAEAVRSVAERLRRRRIGERPKR